MAVALNGGKTASEGDIEGIEAAIGCPMSKAVRNFLNQNDGARPSPNIFNVGGSNNSGVAQFIPAAEIVALRSAVDGLPQRKGVYPIAEDACGNFVLIDESRGGEVLFWDHERDDPPTFLARTLDEFVRDLRAFEGVTLKPGQVKSAWIDPAFLDQIKK